MRIFLIGASGMIGSCILNEAVERGHDVTAAVRNPARIATGEKVSAKAIDVMNPAEAAIGAKGADVIVGAASPRSTGDAATEMKRIGEGYMEAARATGARLVVVGGAGSLDLPDGSPVVAMLEGKLPDAALAEIRAMRAFRDVLAGSGLDWTFFAPPLIIEPGERTGTFRVGEAILLTDADETSRVSAEDFAVAFVDELEQVAHRRKVVTAAY